MISEASAPAKVILFGEHFVVYGVKAILCAIDRRITAMARTIEERKIRIFSSMGNAEVALDSPGTGSAPHFMIPFIHIVGKTIREFKGVGGVEVTLESEIPAGIGLGSSSAACVATAASVTGLFDRKSREEILSLSVEAERKIFEEASGADSAVSTLGGLVSYGRGVLEKIDYKDDLSLIVANSGQVHSTKEVVGRVREFKERSGEMFSQMCNLEAGLVEDALLALEKKDMRSLGRLMAENQKMLEKIGVSTERIDRLVMEADKTCYGSKITGAGGGGCIIALVDGSNSANTLEALEKIGECFVARIDFEGLTYGPGP